MRRMYSENQIKGIVQDSSSEVVEALKGQDISVEGITSKGIANTGGIANIGNVAITGNFSASGKISGGEIVEDMSGYSFDPTTIQITGVTVDFKYAGVVKNGNKLTFSIYFNITRTENTSNNKLATFVIPSEVSAKLFPNSFGYLENKQIWCGYSYNTGTNIYGIVQKSGQNIEFLLSGLSGLTQDSLATCRFEVTFLLSENLAPQE